MEWWQLIDFENKIRVIRNLYTSIL